MGEGIAEADGARGFLGGRRTGGMSAAGLLAVCQPVMPPMDGEGADGNIRLTPLFDTTAEAGKGVGISAVEAAGQGRAGGVGTTF